MVLLKLIGWGCLIFGGLMVISFPSNLRHQTSQMELAGVVLGIILVGVGLLLIKL